MTASASPDTEQDAVTRRYDRIARFYDLIDKPMGLFGVGRRRERLLSRARGRTLEVGIGTGRNLGLYPQDVRLTGIDVSANMLSVAQRSSGARAGDITLEAGDVQHLSYGDDSFDTVTGTCVFCSVADPVAGLREVARVVRSDGQVLLLEHVRPRTALLGWLADRLNPVTRRFMGPEINRRTEDNVVAAGLRITSVRRSGVWREIVARKPSTADEMVP